MANRFLIQKLRNPATIITTATTSTSIPRPTLITSAAASDLFALAQSRFTTPPDHHHHHHHHHQGPPPSPVILDNPAASRIFSSVPTTKLIRSSINLQLAAIEPLVDFGMWVMRSRLMATPLARDIVLGTIKHTFFEHFCAGETIQEAGRSVEKLWETGLRGMLSYGLENAHDNDSCDRNFQAFLDTIESARSLPPSSVSFIVVKLTAMSPISLLRRVSDLLRWEHKDPSFELPWKRQTLPIFADSSPFYHTMERPEPLTSEEERDLELGHERIERLCRACLEVDVPLVIDAEDTFLQPSIDYMTYSSAIRYQKEGGVVLYGTIQAYLKDARERLHLAYHAAHKTGVSMGFKLVRGAYMTSEGKLAHSLGFESPIHDTIQDTHDCYNDCVRFLLNKIAEGSDCRLVLATHNAESGKLAAVKAQDLGIKKDSNSLQFAQLYGMSDVLSFGLRNAGFSVSKYMPFGPIDRIIPYLVRRAEENRGLLSTSSLDRQLMREEIQRRFKAVFM